LPGKKGGEGRGEKEEPLSIVMRSLYYLAGKGLKYKGEEHRWHFLEGGKRGGKDRSSPTHESLPSSYEKKEMGTTKIERRGVSASIFAFSRGKRDLPVSRKRGSEKFAPGLSIAKVEGGRGGKGSRS